MPDPIDRRIREYLETFSETCAASCMDQFEEFIFGQIQQFLEEGLAWEVIQDLVTLCYASYRRGIQDGTEACMESLATVREDHRRDGRAETNKGELMKKDDPRIDLSNPAALGAFIRGDLDNAIVASTPGGIEAQEKAGQTAFNNSDVLPIRLQGITQQELEKNGFLFGAKVDDIFQQAMLPKGWSKRPTDHSMWSSLHDETGKERASIFYKAAFYDRSAFLSWKSEKE